MGNYLFSNYGGSYQLTIKTPEDLKKTIDLDDALWAATSIPIHILNADKKFLEYLDTDCNRRIRSDEIKSAVRWLFRVLKDQTHISTGTDTLFLNSINTEDIEGRSLHESAKIVLSNLNEQKNPDRITLAQVRNLQGIMACSSANGDGIITTDVTQDAELAQLIDLIIKTIGSSKDASGKDGIGASQVTEFFSEAALFLEYLDRGKIPPGKSKTEIMVWGDETPVSFDTIKKVEHKIDEFFAQCAMAVFDERIITALQLKQKELEEMDFTDRNRLLERLKTAPLARINSNLVLTIDKNINPLFVDDINALKDRVLVKIYGPDISVLTQKQWEETKNIFAEYRAYVESKKGLKVEPVGEELLRRYVSGDYRNSLNNLIQKDLEIAEKIRHISNLEKLILYQKYLMEFANNSASFANVYDPEIRSIFEAGTLVIDGRKITFTILITDPNEHKKTAQNSNVYLMYLDITGRHNEDKKFQIVAPITSGDSGTLRVGKRGIFFTRDGIEWDAEVIDIVVNPIGLLESIKAPFIKLTDSIKNQVEKFTKTRESKIETTPVAPSSASMTRDLLVGGGVAIAALGSAAAYITKAVSQVRIVHFITTIGVILLIVLAPSLIMGIIKLRRRNLSILFEASGCAINVRMRLTVGLGRIFTFIPPYPPGSKKKKLDIVAQMAKRQVISGRTSFKRIIKVSLITIVLCLLTYFILFFIVSS